MKRDFRPYPKGINVVPIQARVPRTPPLTDDEIIRLRALLVDFSKVAEHCPLAQRALSKRTR